MAYSVKSFTWLMQGRPRARCRTAPGFRNRVACQAHVYDAGHLACSGRMEVPFDDHWATLRLFAERANQSLMLCKPPSYQPGFGLPNLTAHWLTTRLMFPRVE